jgi:lipopolysaccharide assembly outer membrane protein LptD (OstA)
VNLGFPRFFGGALLVVLLSALPLDAQAPLPAEDLPEAASGAPPPLSGTEEAAAESPAPRRPGELPQGEEWDFYLRLLPTVIAQTEGPELRTWCLRLGLEGEGDEPALRTRLLDYYGVRLPEGEAPGGNPLTIENSGILEYLTGEGDDRIIRFAGEVLLLFRQEDGAQHTIRADMLIFNREQKILSAYGHVQYELLKEGEASPEIFSGNSLVFNVETWEGLFFQGSSQRETGEGEKAVRFLYSGDVIYRSPNDTVILDDGVITTCDEDDPHLQIRASRIWVLGPEEWALLNARFYVGRIPLFYLPAYLKNGDPLFFNPVIGFAADRGYFLQTTTYLLGKKPKEEGDEDVINFMQIAGEESSERVIRGLFLARAEGEEEYNQARRDYAEATESHIKLMADVYSYLGAALGVTGKLSRLGPLESLNFYFSLGRSRQLSYASGLYSPFHRNAAGIYESHWENSYFFGTEVPFRFGFNLEAKLGLKGLSFNLTLPFYSDPYYLVDFDDRQENFKFDQILGTGDTLSTLRRSGSVNRLRSREWVFNLSWSPSFTALRPYLTTFRLNRFDNKFSWSERSISPLPQNSSIDAFFYPASLTYLDHSFALGGTLFSYTRSVPASSGAESSPEPGGSPEGEAGLIPPWQNRSPQESPEGESGDFLPPRGRQGGGINLNQNKPGRIFYHELVWTLNPEGNIYSVFDNASWRLPQDMNNDLEYQILRWNGAGALTYNLDLMDGWFTLSNKIDASGRYNRYFDRGTQVTDTVWQRYLEQADILNQLRISDGITLGLRPFRKDSFFGNSTLSYNLSGYLYRLQYDYTARQLEDISPAWSRTGLTANRGQAALRFLLFSREQSLNLTVDLPPLAASYSGVLSLNTGPLSSYFSQSLKEQSDGAFQWSSFYVRENLSLNGFSLAQELYYRWDEDSLERSVTSYTLKSADSRFSFSGSLSYDFFKNTAETGSLTLRYGPLDMSFVMRNTIPYEYAPGTGWQSSGVQTRFIPDSLKIHLVYPFAPLPLWKNRIVLKGELRSAWDWNLIQFTSSPFSIDFQLSLNIYQFIDLQFTAHSQNQATFRYFAPLARRVGVEPLNVFTDLAKSFNFFNRQDRLESNFNLSSINISLVHDLHDWDLTLEYKGYPELDTSQSVYAYRWRTTFSIFVQWKAWRKLEARAEMENDVWKL